MVPPLTTTHRTSLSRIWESEIITQWQSQVRTPWLDTYFLHTSMLGTHTFFLVFLPA
ncbi:hypothetical protein EDB83DRAFT_2419266, partial [Lactarius deliciosus]